MKWILVQDRPYYPSVQEFESRERAEAALEAVAESTEGRYPLVAYLAEVVERHELRSHH